MLLVFLHIYYHHLLFVNHTGHNKWSTDLYLENINDLVWKKSDFDRAQHIVLINMLLNYFRQFVNIKTCSISKPSPSVYIYIKLFWYNDTMQRHRTGWIWSQKMPSALLDAFHLLGLLLGYHQLSQRTTFQWYLNANTLFLPFVIFCLNLPAFTHSACSHLD